MKLSAISAAALKRIAQEMGSWEFWVGQQLGSEDSEDINDSLYTSLYKFFRENVPKVQSQVLNRLQPSGQITSESDGREADLERYPTDVRQYATVSFYDRLSAEASLRIPSTVFEEFLQAFPGEISVAEFLADPVVEDHLFSVINDVSGDTEISIYEHEDIIEDLMWKNEWAEIETDTTEVDQDGNETPMDEVPGVRVDFSFSEDAAAIGDPVFDEQGVTVPVDISVRVSVRSMKFSGDYDYDR